MAEKLTRAKALEKLKKLREQLDDPEADVEAIEAEIDQIEQALENLAEAAEDLAQEAEPEARDGEEEEEEENQEGEDEEEERGSLARQRAQLRARVAAGMLGAKTRDFKNLEGNPMKKTVYTAASPEYRTAYFKNLMGRDMTAEERAAFVHTTANTAAVLPTETLNEIWDLITGQHSIMGDIRILRSGTTIEVIKHTAVAQGNAAQVNENAANDDEQNTFVKVTLAGHDFSKHIDISYALERMSIDAFENYIVNEIAALMGEAMSADVVNNAIIAKMAAANKVTSGTVGKIAFKELAGAFGLLKRAGSVVVYGTRKTIYTYLVGMEDSQGRPIFQPNAQTGAEGFCLGATVKVEDAVADGVLLIGDGSKVTYNMVQDIMIENDKDIKKHVTTYAGYARGEGALIDDTAFATLTVKTA